MQLLTCLQRSQNSPLMLKSDAYLGHTLTRVLGFSFGLRNVCCMITQHRSGRLALISWTWWGCEGTIFTSELKVVRLKKESWEGSCLVISSLCQTTTNFLCLANEMDSLRSLHYLQQDILVLSPPTTKNIFLWKMNERNISSWILLGSSKTRCSKALILHIFTEMRNTSRLWSFVKGNL